MIRKTEVLNGVVKEFINEQSYLKYFMRDFEYSYQLERNIRNLYLQAFQPEMISEYFKCETDGKKEYPAIKIQLFEFENDNYIIAEERKINKTDWQTEIRFGKVIYRPEDDVFDYTRNYAFNPQPKTLSHFISACIQCGIELIWNE